MLVAEVELSVRQLSEGHAHIMTKSKIDQRVEIKFCVQSGFTQAETVRRIIQVHGANALSVSQVRRWFGAFSRGRVETADLPRPGQPLRRTAAKIQHVDTIVRQDRRQTVRQVAARSNLSFGCAHRTLKKDLLLKKKCAHWVPHRLTPQQRQRRVDRARAALRMLGRNGPVDHVVCGDESWFYCWDPASRRDNRQWLTTNAATPAVPVHEQSVQKVMLVIFFDWQGLVYRCFVPQGQGINGALYLQILQNLRDAVRRRRPQVWRARHWGLLHDGAPAHRSFPVQTWLNNAPVNLPQVPQPPYSPDLNPLDFWLFAKLKKLVRGELFPDTQQLMNTLDYHLGQIPQHEWAAAMDRYKPRCIQAQGNYFEHP